MKKLAYCAGLFLGFCVPSFAAVHAASRTVKFSAEKTYKVTKGAAKAAYRVGKYAGRQVF